MPYRRGRGRLACYIEPTKLGWLGCRSEEVFGATDVVPWLSLPWTPISVISRKEGTQGFCGRHVSTLQENSVH